MVTKLLTALASAGYARTIAHAYARYNWAKVRDFVQTRSHALFWYTCVGKRLCAPGGAWAARDRAAFEEEFIQLR